MIYYINLLSLVVCHENPFHDITAVFFNFPCRHICSFLFLNLYQKSENETSFIVILFFRNLDTTVHDLLVRVRHECNVRNNNLFSVQKTFLLQIASTTMGDKKIRSQPGTGYRTL